MQTGAAGTDLEIKHEEHDGLGVFFLPGGASGRLAELTYRSSRHIAVIELRVSADRERADRRIVNTGIGPS